jgi:hypothetical protein
MAAAFDSVTLLFAHVDWSIKNNISRRPRVILDPGQTIKLYSRLSRQNPSLTSRPSRPGSRRMHATLYYTTLHSKSGGDLHCDLSWPDVLQLMLQAPLVVQTDSASCKASKDRSHVTSI